MPGHWHTGPTYYDDVLNRWVKTGEWVPYGEPVEQGAGESTPPAVEQESSGEGDADEQQSDQHTTDQAESAADEDTTGSGGDDQGQDTASGDDQAEGQDTAANADEGRAQVIEGTEKTTDNVPADAPTKSTSTAGGRRRR